MTLEQSISELTLASNTLTQTASDYLNEINRWRADVASWRVEQTQVILVGKNQLFQSIQAAWDSLTGKVLTAPVTIKLEDGIYEETLWLGYHPYAYLIRIEGNVVNPSQCVIRLPKHLTDNTTLLMCTNVQRLRLAGFTLQNQSDLTQAKPEFVGLCIAENSLVYCDPSSIIVEGFHIGVGVTGRSFLWMENTILQNCIHGFMVAGSHAHVSNSTIEGFSEKPGYGLFVYDNGVAYGHNMQVNQFELGITSRNVSYVWCDKTEVSNCSTGFGANMSGSMASSDCKASHCHFGFLCDGNSAFDAIRNQADLCDYGFIAGSGGVLNATESYATNCNIGYHAATQALIEAFNTQANSSNVNMLYSPPTYAIPGNDQGMIRMS